MFDKMPLVVDFITQLGKKFVDTDPTCVKCGHIDLEHKDSVAGTGGTRICKYPASSDSRVYDGQTCPCGNLQLKEGAVARPFDASFERKPPLSPKYNDTK